MSFKSSSDEGKFEAELTALLAAEAKAKPKPKTKTNAKTSDDCHDDLAILLKQNLLVSQEIERLTKRIYSFIVFSRVMWWVKLLIVVIPLIMAFVYLPPFVQTIINSYNELLMTKNQLVSSTSCDCDCKH